MGMSKIQTLGVGRQYIIPDFPRPVNDTSAFDLSVQHLLGQAVLLYDYTYGFNHHCCIHIPYVQSKYLDYMIKLVLV